MDVTFLAVDCGVTHHAGCLFPGVLVEGVPHGDVLTGSVSFGANDPVLPTVEFILPSQPIVCVLDENEMPVDWFEAPEGQFDCGRVLLEEELFKTWGVQDRPTPRLVIAMRRVWKVPGVLRRVPWIELDGQRIHKISSVTLRRDHYNRDSESRCLDRGPVSWVQNGVSEIVECDDVSPWFAEVHFIGVPSVEILPNDEINRVLGKEPASA